VSNELFFLSFFLLLGESGTFFEFLSCFSHPLSLLFLVLSCSRGEASSGRLVVVNDPQTENKEPEHSAKAKLARRMKKAQDQRR
jgi:hypothetical protein